MSYERCTTEGGSSASERVHILPYSTMKYISFRHTSSGIDTSHAGTGYATSIRFLHGAFHELRFYIDWGRRWGADLTRSFFFVLQHTYHISQTFLHRWKRLFGFFLVKSYLNVQYLVRNWEVCCFSCILSMFEDDEHRNSRVQIIMGFRFTAL